MRFRLGSKKVVLTLSVILVLLLAVSGTLAYIFTESASLENEFQPSHISCAVVENGKQYSGEEVNVSEKKNVQIQNTGDTAAYIRAKVVVTWKSHSNTLYAKAPQEENDYTMTFAPDSGWVKGADDFYYYTLAVSPAALCNHTDGQAFCEQCMTKVLISECSMNANANKPEGCYLSVEIIASAIQATPDYVVEDEWDNENVKIDANNGTLTITSEKEARA